MELTFELKAEYKSIIGKKVSVIIDRPIGTAHPKHPDVIYPINYGYIEELLGGDGEEQDVYVLGEDAPIAKFEGEVIAVVHRYNDNECKWVASKGKDYSKEQIRRLVNFQEQFYSIEIIA